MTGEDFNNIFKFFSDSWLIAGAIGTFVGLILITKNKLKRDGYLTVGDILLGGLMLATFILAGWITLVLLGIVFKEHLEGIFGVKIFRTKEFKTKHLLYTEDEHD